MAINYRHLIDVDDLQGLLAAGECRVVDCRFNLMQPDLGRLEYLEGHIPGAVHADLDQDLAGPVTDASGRHPLPAQDDFLATLQRWGIEPGSQAVVYDQAGGALASRLWWMLRWVGHPRVAVLNGGIDAWRAAGLPLERFVPEYAPSAMRGNAEANLVTTTDEISASLAGDGDLRLVDARERVRFAGESEPIDSVAGHVPGAVNLPFADNLHPDGTWKSADELRQNWEKVLGAGNGAPVTVMCGSGVTACHLVLSATLAGIAEPRLYVGSWSEWIRDAGRAVARGA